MLDTQNVSDVSSLTNILLLEDEPADAYLTKLAFKENNISANFHHVVDGREGIDFLEKKGVYANAPRPDIIFLDLNMPRMNGSEFLTVIKANQKLNDIPVIVLTTSEVESDIVRSYQLGAASYIVKPVDVQQFLSAVNQIGGYWLSLVRLPQGHKV